MKGDIYVCVEANVCNIWISVYHSFPHLYIGTAVQGTIAYTYKRKTTYFLFVLRDTEERERDGSILVCLYIYR